MIRALLIAAFLAAFAVPASAQPYNYYSGSGGAAARSGVVSAGYIELHGCIITNTAATPQYIQFFNTTTVPADGAVPAMAPIIVPAASSIGLDFTAATKRVFTTGVTWAQSSTAATKTLSGTSDTYLSCSYN